MIPDKYFDPLSPSVLADPFPSYQRLRGADPVYWHEQLKSWVVTRHADCAFVLANTDPFTTDFRKIDIPTPAPLLSLQTIDPPEHTPLRNFGKDALHAQNLKSLEEATSRHAELLLNELESRESFDFVSDFADPFTLGMICNVLGVDPPERDAKWDLFNNHLDESMDHELAPDSQLAGLAAREHFNALVNSWIAKPPEKGLVRYIVDNIEQAGVPTDVLVNSVRAFWHAGFEVPSRFLANALVALLKHPAAMRSVDPNKPIDTAVEELIRFAGPVHALSRACIRDTPLRDKLIRRGDVVIALIAAGNRDPEVFDRPEDLDLHRLTNPHLGFGRGPHACMGGHLARMEARIAIQKIIQRFPHMELVEEPKPRANATLRGPAVMKMTFAGAPELAGAMTLS